MGNKIRVAVVGKTADNWYEVGRSYDVLPASMKSSTGFEYDELSYEVDETTCISARHCVEVVTEYKTNSGLTFYDFDEAVKTMQRIELSRIAGEYVASSEGVIGRQFSPGDLATFLMEKRDEIEEVLNWGDK